MRIDGDVDEEVSVVKKEGSEKELIRTQPRSTVLTCSIIRLHSHTSQNLRILCLLRCMIQII